jgi:hypothetical protein
LTPSFSLANVPEVLKTRLQLQGELVKADPNAPKVYRNVMDVFVKTWRNEGFKGLQRGLLPAVSARKCLHLFTDLAHLLTSALSMDIRYFVPISSAPI